MSTLKINKKKVEGSIEDRINQNKSGLMESVYNTLLNEMCTLRLMNSVNPVSGVLRAVDTYSILFEEVEENVEDGYDVIQYHHVMKSAIESLSFDPNLSDKLSTEMYENIRTKNGQNKTKPKIVRKKFKRKIDKSDK